MNIAISLICHNDLNYMIPCLDSLFESDLNLFNYKLFCYDNNSNEETKLYLNNLSINKWIYNSPTNDGIVNPRIKIFEEIKKENFDLLLEIHTDMIFPKFWLSPLLELLDDDTGILEPHIYVPKTRSNIDINFVNKRLPELVNDKTYSICRQTHPWIINIKNVDKVGGYYDSNYSPHECEDDDFVYRVFKSGLKIRSTAKSWVLHYGGVTRHSLGNYLNSHIQYFEQKNKIKFNEFLKIFEIHPYHAE